MAEVQSQALVFEALMAAACAFPTTRNLVVIRAFVGAGIGVEFDVADLAELIAWGTPARYLGEWDELTEQEAKRATEMARRVVRSVELALDVAEDAPSSDC